MITRPACIEDTYEIYKLLASVPRKEAKYLFEGGVRVPLAQTIIKSILEQRIILFVNDEKQIIGYLEYEIRKECLHILSLYIKKSSRSYMATVELLKVYKKLKDTYRLDVYFYVHESNAPALAQARYIKAKQIEKFADGTISFLVPYKED